MKRLAFIGVAVLLASGCETVATPEAKAQRCAVYRSTLATAVELQKTQPTDARARRIVYYQGLIATCPPAPEVPTQ